MAVSYAAENLENEFDTDPVSAITECGGMYKPEYRAKRVEDHMREVLSRQLTDTRMSRGLSARALADKAGISRRYVHAMENTRTKALPSLRILLRLAEALSVGVELRLVPFNILMAYRVNRPANCAVQSLADDVVAADIYREMGGRVQRERSPLLQP
jgi:transcriptional regulator with XRE-family HTH domain